MRRLRLSWQFWKRPRRFSPVPNTDPTLYARARPRSVLVEERYQYAQEVSRNGWTRPDGHPSGRVSVRLPYDGHKCFPRDAVRDVEVRIADRAELDQEATVGHLAFVDHEDTDLSDVLELPTAFAALPLRVPVRSTRLESTDALTGDRLEHRFDAAYRVTGKRPELLPLKLDVELTDPDHNDQLFTERGALYALHEDNARSVANALTKFAGFKPFLMLQIRADLTLPPRAGHDRQPPVIRRVRVTLPQSASVPASSVSLHAEGADELQVDGRSGSLTFSGTTMYRSGDNTTGSAPRHFANRQMVLHFEQPGELFDQRHLDVEVDIEVPDELLSGTQVRLFDARGHRHPGPKAPLTVRSVITTTCRVILGDAFTDRYVSPFQNFVFDEIVPGPMRIADVHAALTDRRFEVREVPLPENNGKKRTRHLLLAQRVDGPETMALAVLVEGRRHPTRREARQPVGHRYTSKFESGSLHIYVRGQVRGDTRNLVQEITAFQQALRERFRMLKAHR